MRMQIYIIILIPRLIRRMRREFQFPVRQVIRKPGGIDVRYCYPANYSKTIAVSAIDSSGRLANYSNRGNGIDFAAPGTGIISADYKGNLTLRAMSGTSMAAPHITAAIAYLKMMR